MLFICYMCLLDMLLIWGSFFTGDDVQPSPFSMTNLGEWDKFRNIDMDKEVFHFSCLPILPADYTIVKKWLYSNILLFIYEFTLPPIFHMPSDLVGWLESCSYYSKTRIICYYLYLLLFSFLIYNMDLVFFHDVTLCLQSFIFSGRLVQSRLLKALHPRRKVVGMWIR